MESFASELTSATIVPLSLGKLENCLEIKITNITDQTINYDWSSRRKTTLERKLKRNMKYKVIFLQIREVGQRVNACSQRAAEQKIVEIPAKVVRRW